MANMEVGEIVNVVCDGSLSEREREFAASFAIKSAYQKRQKSTIKLDNKAAIKLSMSHVEEFGSKCLAIIVNYYTSIKMSAIHHIYHKNGSGIANLEIENPLFLSKIPFGRIGTYGGIQLWHSQYKPMDRFPPLLINSMHEAPIEITINRSLPRSLAPRNVKIKDGTVFANCIQVIESDYRATMKAWENLEDYKRTMKELTKITNTHFKGNENGR